jgi:formyltetrahydrofolate-dependent phosphoribosylglycinamide formyltransferase
MSKPLRLAVLLSGSGRTLANLLAKQAAGELAAEFAIVISSHAGVRGLEIAEQAEIPTKLLRPKEFASNADYGQAVFDACRAAGAELVVMAGFIKYVPIPRDFENRVVNIHPGLIPAFCGHGFYGHHVHQAVLDYGAKVSGCTVHFVDNEYDHGPIILQQVVPVLDDDTADSLAARVFEAECTAFPKAIQLIAAGRVSMDGRRVRVR